RLTWNPLKHIDPFLTILLPMMLWFATSGNFVFGGAKPVPVDPRNYRQLRRGDIIVSMAGIVTNLALVVLLVLAIIGLGLLGRAVPVAQDSLSLLQRMFVSGIVVNLVLAIFNLFPLPPLDGSHVMKWLLPPAWRARYVRLGGFGLVILMLLMTVGRPILGAWMAPVSWLFEAGRVTVNGAVAVLGQVVDPARDRILVDGAPVAAPAPPQWFVLHKP
ncbi:MAG: site-2 protease family protein, partial [Gemmatimonadota bacterium]